MRPIYETRQTLEVEANTMRQVCEVWGAKEKKLASRYQIDWAVMDHSGAMKAWAECKRRYHAFGHYDTLMLSLGKFREGRQLSLDTNMPFLLIVEWDDGIRWARASADMPAIGLGGREDRSDPDDIEPCVFIPVEMFKPLRS